MQRSTTSKLFREHVLTSSDENGLVAIATEPAATDAARPVVLMLNAGVLHRTGPHRLHVLLARELAARGFFSCRVDLSGIGDSRAIAGTLSFRESSVADARIVMDHLAAGFARDRFVVFGLCSGADNGLAVAAADPRVAGLVLIDAPSYASLRARGRKLFRRGIHSGTRAAARLLGNIIGRRGGDVGAPPGRQAPPMHEYRKLLNSLVDRRVDVLFIYSAAMSERYNHADQLFELFPELRGRVSVGYFADADHAFTENATQRRLIDAVVGWLGRTYP